MGTSREKLTDEGSSQAVAPFLVEEVQPVVDEDSLFSKLNKWVLVGKTAGKGSGFHDSPALQCCMPGCAMLLACWNQAGWSGRLLPLFFMMVVLNYLDRTALAFGAIQMNKDLGFTPEVYGLGSGLFFTTYATLQVPSNIILRKVGGPKWLSAIIAAWGTCALSFAFVRTKAQFFILRALLGVAEAGAFPGMWFMLSRFYPPERITLAFAVAESGISFSHTVAGPLAAGLLSLDDVFELRGWQWLFLLEGVPSLLLAVALLYLLPPSPEKARILTPAERQHLTDLMGHKPDDIVLSPGSVISPAGGFRFEKAASIHDSAPDSVQIGLDPEDVKETTNLLVTIKSSDRAAPNSSAAGAKVYASGRQAVCGRVERLAVRWLGADVVTSLVAAGSNKYVWYMGCTKIIKDIAGYGILFFAPMIVQAIVKGHSLHLQDSAKGQRAPPRSAQKYFPYKPESDPRMQGLLDSVNSSNQQAGQSPEGLRGLLAMLGPMMSDWVVQRVSSRPHQAEEVAAVFAPTGSDMSAHGSWQDGGASSTYRFLMEGLPEVEGDTGVVAALLTSIPFGLAAAATLIIAHRSQARGERVLHMSLPPLIGGVTFLLFPWIAQYSIVAAFIVLCVAVVGCNSASAPGLALLSDLSAGPGLVVALPLYNSMGNIGGFLGPSMIGVLLATTNSFVLPTTLMAVCLTISGILLFSMTRILGLPPGMSPGGIKQ